MSYKKSELATPKKKDKEHLPMYGVGPFYGIGIIFITVLSIFLSKEKICRIGVPTGFEVVFIILGVTFIILGVYIWVRAVLIDKLEDSVKENRLLVTGIYGWVRNPIYTAIAFACSGSLFLASDVWLLVLPFVFWLILTVLMKHTEEKWLKNVFGKEYEEYCKKVNRCIPWFPKK